MTIFEPNALGARGKRGHRIERAASPILTANFFPDGCRRGTYRGHGPFDLCLCGAKVPTPAFHGFRVGDVYLAPSRLRSKALRVHRGSPSYISNLLNRL